VDERWILLDRETGLHVGWYFWLRLLDEVGRSDRYGSSFGLLLLEVGTAPGAPRKNSHEALARVSVTIRGTDLGGLVTPSKAAIILTQQEPDAAERASTRILALLSASASNGVSWRSELLCYPRDAAAVTHLLTLRGPERVSA
jgi:hypothetical protein